MNFVTAERPVATRVDGQNGYSDEATFFSSGGQSVFGVLHRPQAEPAAGVVICPSTDSEFATYGIDVAIARMLASRGLAVQRFHPRGFGHSDGQPQEVTFETMRADALVAAERLVEQTGTARIGFMGARFGGLVAASAAAKHPGCPLALIEPALDATRFFRNAWRATLIRDVQAGTSERARGHGLADALSQSETVDLLGYSICRPFFESSTGRTLVDELDTDARHVLLIQLGRETTVRADMTAVSESLQTRGCEVQVELVADDVTWWFPPAAEAERPRRRGLVSLTSGWLGNELAAVAA
jgi:pimeloyl-ACP methyl ester carboxylesterase